MNLLTVELVPSTCWYSNVRSNVSAADWNRCKRFVRDRSGDRCEICGGRGKKWPVECHEIWEYTSALVAIEAITGPESFSGWRQTLTGLIALCPNCHLVKHIGRAETTGNLPQALKHLMRVNQWSEEDATSYLEMQFELWAMRSTVEWELDISWLSTLGIIPTAPRNP
jgi:hypothetical protein